ncbi:hypothetical protein LC724_00420 [Blautia sp. RD014234]|nr:hypothetical protein [Blautia parvula]
MKKSVVFFHIPIGTRKPSKNREKTIKEIEKMSEKLSVKSQESHIEKNIKKD